MTAEPIIKIKEARSVLKVLQKMDRELQVLKKKHDKVGCVRFTEIGEISGYISKFLEQAKEKERELQQIREAKLAQSQEKQKSQLVKAQSKIARKLSKASGNQYV